MAEQNIRPQLTFKAITLSIVLTVLLAAANAYLGLFAGMTIATAIPAAVVSMAVLRLFGPPNILENNIVATGASAGSSIASGAIFTLPALVLLHYWKDFSYTWTLAIVGLGGLLGVTATEAEAVYNLWGSAVTELHATSITQLLARVG